jgi:threonine aldolase
MGSATRRGFLGRAGALGLVGLAPPWRPAEGQQIDPPASETSARRVNFWADGLMPGPEEHAATLAELARDESELKDRYGVGGAVERLEQAFATLAGKERALYLPTGTMANQLAIHVLSGTASKVFVQESSHVFRDEADAAQVVHGKRLVPLAEGRGTFTAAELDRAMRDVGAGEAFPTRPGALSIENPVRRADGAVFPWEDLEQICALARDRGLGLHLDGARLLLACEYTGRSVADYAGLVDTVYVSLYKYLEAPAGAVLCGPTAVIEQVIPLRKVHGGDLYQSWPNAAVALRALRTFPERLRRSRVRADDLFAALEATGRFRVNALTHGSNVFCLDVGEADRGAFVTRLRTVWNVIVPEAEDDGIVRLHVNETQSWRSTEALVEAFVDAHRQAAAEAGGRVGRELSGDGAREGASR